MDSEVVESSHLTQCSLALSLSPSLSGYKLDLPFCVSVSYIVLSVGNMSQAAKDRPASLASSKDSHAISKLKPKIRIVHIVTPEIIKTDVGNFRELVQRLTGKPATGTGSKKQAPPVAAIGAPEDVKEELLEEEADSGEWWKEGVSGGPLGDTVLGGSIGIAAGFESTTNRGIILN
ncbi:VQ motif [Musa troglodytarum]|uniref:VQ motif n=1 Tax=Musa troglodytarum TaxID=320322 RepID=A0A9E7GYF3_9LILI|nr:VQ motif [Musa troglodytarum]